MLGSVAGGEFSPGPGPGVRLTQPLSPGSLAQGQGSVLVGAGTTGSKRLTFTALASKQLPREFSQQLVAPSAVLAAGDVPPEASESVRRLIHETYSVRRASRLNGIRGSHSRADASEERQTIVPEGVRRSIRDHIVGDQNRSLVTESENELKPSPAAGNSDFVAQECFLILPRDTEIDRLLPLGNGVFARVVEPVARVNEDEQSLLFLTHLAVLLSRANLSDGFMPRRFSSKSDSLRSDSILEDASGPSSHAMPSGLFVVPSSQGSCNQNAEEQNASDAALRSYVSGRKVAASLSATAASKRSRKSRKSAVSDLLTEANHFLVGRESGCAQALYPSVLGSKDARNVPGFQGSFSFADRAQGKIPSGASHGAGTAFSPLSGQIGKSVALVNKECYLVVDRGSQIGDQHTLADGRRFIVTENIAANVAGDAVLCRALFL